MLSVLEQRIAGIVSKYSKIGRDYRIAVATDRLSVVEKWAAKNPRVCYYSSQTEVRQQDGEGINEASVLLSLAHLTPVSLPVPVPCTFATLYICLCVCVCVYLSLPLSASLHVFLSQPASHTD